MDKTPTSVNPSQETIKAPAKNCPYCREKIAAEAQKCKHCGEFLQPISIWQKVINKSVTYIGVFTAILSVFYACREGYFYIQAQQQVRADKATYIQTADEFIKMDALAYAKQTLNKALKLSPNDVELQRRVLLIDGHDWLLKESGFGENVIRQQALEQLIIDGFRLLNLEQTPEQKAMIEVLVARLLSYDTNWNDDPAITQLFENAYKRLPNNVELQFQLGVWLVYSDVDIIRGTSLVKQAAKLAKDNAVYWADYAEISVSQENYIEGFYGFRKAIALLPKQKSIQAIRASNLSKTGLRQLLRQTDKLFDFAQGGFLGLNHKQRTELIEQVAIQSPKDREIAKIAVRYFYAQQNFQKAYSFIEVAFSEQDLTRRKTDREFEMFSKYLRILETLGENPKLQTQLSEQLNNLKGKLED